MLGEDACPRLAFHPDRQITKPPPTLMNHLCRGRRWAADGFYAGAVVAIPAG
jgi:hypothetical protein